MTARQFVESLANSAGSIEAYKKLGLSTLEANSFRDMYICRKRTVPLGIEVANELFVLLNGWHLDSIRIGMISFFETPSILAHGVQIGVVECDPLIIHSNGEMCVHEFGFQDNILWSVAKSPSHVLEPLSLAAKFLGDRVFEEIESDDFVAAKVLATRCTALAGGDEHLDFFKMLLGAER